MMPMTIILAFNEFVEKLQEQGVCGVQVMVSIARDVEEPKNGYQLRCELPPADQRVLQLEAELAQAKADMKKALEAGK